MRDQVRIIAGWYILLFVSAGTALGQQGYSESEAYSPRTISQKNVTNRKDQPQSPQAVTSPTPVSIRVSVLDSNFKPVGGLAKGDFKLFVDDQEAEISSVDNGSEPVTFVLLIDNSISSTMAIKDLGDRVKRLIDALDSNDRVMAFAFSERLRLLADVTADREKLYKAVRKVTEKGESGTSLYDHIHALSTQSIANIEGPAAIILFTDGVDSTSRKVKPEVSLESAESADAANYVAYLDTLNFVLASTDRLRQNRRSFPLPVGIKLQDPRQTQMEYAIGKRYLSDLMHLSGGHTVRDPNDLGAGILTTSALPSVIRSQYVIKFTPTFQSAAGQRHALRVRVNRPNLNVIARGSLIRPQ
jgi:VWFA-related protein